MLNLAILRLLWYSGAIFIASAFSSVSSFYGGLCSVFLLPAMKETPVECCSLHRWILKASALISFLFIYTHKIDHCAEGTANNKTIAVKEDLPQTVLITSKGGDQGNTNHGEPHLHQWHGTCFPLWIITSQPITNMTDPNLTTSDPLCYFYFSALLLSLLN